VSEAAQGIADDLKLVSTADALYVAPAMPAGIAKSLVKAQALVERVGKDGNNKFHHYRYTSAEAVMEAARDPMAAAGLAIVQMGWTLTDPRIVDTLEWVPAVEGKSGKDDRFIPQPSKDILPGRTTVRFLLTHDSGETWEMPPIVVPVIPEAGRPWDKALFTALTFAEAYALRGLLKMPRSGDPDETEAGSDDGDQRDDRNTTPSGAKRRETKVDPEAKAERISEQVGTALDNVPNEDAPTLEAWCDRFAGKANAAIGMERLRPHVARTAKRLDVPEAQWQAWLAKAVAAHKASK
jgi:hypothetical protein